MIKDLIENVTLLVALSAFYSLLNQLRSSRTFWNRIFMGVLFGGMAVGSMVIPFHYSPGIIYDSRYIILTLAGLFGGGTVALIAAIIAGIYRVFLGGIGVWAGLATIISTALIGLFFRSKVNNHPEKLNLLAFFGIGVVAHIVMLACQLLIPWPMSFQIIEKIWLPVLIIFPITTMLIASLLKNENERIDFQRRLQESETLYRDLVETAQDLIWQCDTEGRYTYLNPEWENVFGYNVEEMLGKKFTDFQTPEWAERDSHEFKQVLKGENARKWETVHIGKDGQRIHLVIKAKVFYDTQGQPAGVRGTAYDITESKKQHDKLEKVFDNLQDILENMSDAFVALDRNWRYIYVNKKAGELLGRKPEYLLGKHIWTEFPEGVGQPFHRNYERAMNEGIFIQMEDYYPPYDRWFENRIHPTKDGIAIFFNDITERKHTEELLHQSEEKFRLAFHNSPDINCISSLKDGKYLEINKEFTKIMGYNPEEVIGKTSLELNIWVNPEDRKRLVNELKEKGQVINFEAQYRTKSGNILTGLTSAAIININNEPCLITMTRDITKLKKAEEQLRFSEEKFRLAFKNSPDAVNINTIDGIYVDINDGFTKLTGFTRDDVIGKSSAEINIWAIPSDREKLIAGLKERGYVSNLESKFRCKNGFIRTALMSAAIINIDGLPHILSITRDITDLKKTEAELYKTKQQLESIYDSVHDVIFYLSVESDETYRFISVNKAFLQATGLKRDQVEGKIVDEVIPEPSLTMVKNNYKKAIDEKRMVEWEETSEYPAGLKTALVNVVPVIDEHGNCTHLVGSVHDITEIQQAQDKLRKAYERLRILSEIDHAIISAVSPQTIAQDALEFLHQIIPFRSAIVVQIDIRKQRVWMLAVYGDDEIKQDIGIRFPLMSYSNSDIVKQGKVELIPELEQWPQKTEIQKRLLKNGIHSMLNVPLVFDKELIGILTLNSEEPNSITNEYMDIAQEVAQQLAVAIHQAWLNEQLQIHAKELELHVAQRTQELKESYKELEDFAYSVSHDLRAPLRAIRGFAEIISQRYKNNLNEEGQRYLEYILQAAGQMENLINDLLKYGRLGKRVLSYSPVSISMLVKEIIDDFVASGLAKDAEIIFDKELPIIEGDATLLRQVFCNIIENALKYRKKDVKHRVKIRGKTEDKWAIIEVIDNGIGISPQHHDKIFNIFQRLHSQEDYSGTGIGLAIVKKAVNVMNGEVEVESEPGKGSIFRVKLKYDKKQVD